MDADVYDAVTVVDVNSGQAGEWFDLVQAAYSAANGDWAAFQQNLTGSVSGVFAAAAETLVRHVADHGGIELVGRIVADIDSLPAVYAEAKAPAQGNGAQKVDQDALWRGVVEQFGGGWAAWDGSDAGWVQFRDWLYSAANARSSDMYAAAFGRLDPLNGQPLAERIAKLTEFGFTINATAAQDRFGWVRDEQRASLVGAWGANWTEHLGPQLDYRWGSGWEGNPAEHKAYWLADLLPELTTAAGGTESSNPGEEADALPEPDAAWLKENLAAPAVAEAIAAIPGAEQLTQEDVEAAIAAVLAELEQEAGA